MEGITKSFGSATALDEVDLSLERGEVHALVGENGAGKSTLMKILTGAYHRDAGTVLLEGHPVDFDTPAEAQAAGVCAVHQEIHLLGHHTVAENIFLGREPRRFGFVHWRRMFDETRLLLEGLGLDVDPHARVCDLSTARQQMVAIARGMSLGAKVLVLDEPTSSLSPREVAILYDLVGRLKSQGTAIVYISHRFDELYAICDRVTVLRDGRLVGTRPLAGLERLDLVCLMLGKSRDELRAGTTAFSDGTRTASPGAEIVPLLRTEHVAGGAKLRDVSVTVRAGEIVGLAGLLGSGRTEMARVVFGADPRREGAVFMNGTRVDPRAPDDAIELGIGFVSEDRKAEGIIPDLSIRENLTLAALPALSRFGIVSRTRQREIVERYMQRLGIKATSADQHIRELSGGNQQKVLLARWLCTHPRLLILDEPTRGIDIGAKGEIQELVNELAGQGLGVLMISSELEELTEGASRVVVLRDGRDVAELTGDAISPQAIIHAMADEPPRDSAEPDAPPG
jgi:ribose transport system ATP-binding protein